MYKRQVDAVVLGCTHYPLVRKTIQKVLGSGVAVFDGGAGTARETLHKLKEYSLVSDAVTPGTVQFYNSTEDQAMIELSKYLDVYKRQSQVCRRLPGRRPSEK